MVPPLLVDAILGPTVGELLSGPLSNMLDTVVPHENVAPRAALRMIAGGALTPEEYFEIDAFKELSTQDQKVMFKYAYDLRRRFEEVTLRTLQKPFLKEGVDIFKSLDDFDKAEFLGGLDDATKRLRDVENELERLDRTERDAWMKEELAFNNTLVRIVEDRIKKIEVTA